MQITRQADYAIRAILFLVKTPVEKRSSTGDIARTQDIPRSFLAKIISQLSIAGIIHTTRGAKGGVTLARDAAEISLLDVVVAIDGPVALNECTLDDTFCGRSRTCPMHNVWCEAQRELVYRLEKARFSQFI
jgi:Rrf2 family protein